MDGKLRLWNIPDKKVALWNEIEGVGQFGIFIRLSNHSSCIRCPHTVFTVPMLSHIVGSHFITAANFCMDGKLAVAGTYDGRCIFYETEVPTQSCTRTLV